MTIIVCDHCGKTVSSITAVTNVPDAEPQELCESCWNELITMEMQAVAAARELVAQRWLQGKKQPATAPEPKRRPLLCRLGLHRNRRAHRPGADGVVCEKCGESHWTSIPGNKD